MTESGAPSSASGPSLRVMFVDRGLTFYGGVSRVLLSFARTAAARTLHLELGVLEAPVPEMEREFAAVRVPVHHLGHPSYLGPARRLRRRLRDGQFSVLVCNSLRSYLIGKLAAAGTRCRVVYWMHGIGEVNVHPVKRGFFRRLSTNDTLLFISQAVCRANLDPGRRGQHQVIYNGVEDPQHSPALRPYPCTYRAKFGLPSEGRVLGYVASFDARKDHPTLLRAFEQLWQRFPDLHLVLIGRGERAEQMQALSRSLAGHAQVHFLGARTDARALLGLLDLYVHPSREEGFGLAVAEALLAGLPVVASDADGLSEVVRHGQTGLLFRAGDSDDLVRQVSALLEAPALAQRLALAGQLDCRQRFAPEHFAAQVVELLRAEQGRLAASRPAPLTRAR